MAKRQEFFRILKNGVKDGETEYPSLGMAAAEWALNPEGRTVVKVDAEGVVLERFEPGECQEAAHSFNNPL